MGKAMKMDPDMMKKTMEMMRDNPAMISNAQKVMENMTPEDLIKQSKNAQEQLSKMTPNDLETANKIMQQIPDDQMNAAAAAMMKNKGQNTANLSDAIIESAATTVDDDNDDDDDDDDDVKPMETGPGSSSDKNVVDAMFRVAEYMSDPPTKGGVTIAGFYSLPPIQLLSGGREFDLSTSELKECWANGSLGAARVDRAGFERVLKEVQEYFEEDIMTEARKEAKKRTKKTRNKASTKKEVTSDAATTTIGSNMSSKELDEINNRVKNLSNDDVSSVLDMMEKVDPVQEARLKSMGVDPKLMQQTAAMLKDNPAMREQAKKMMQSMSPDQMLKMSQEAQKQMANMSESDVQTAIDQMKNPPKDLNIS